MGTLAGALYCTEYRTVQDCTFSRPAQRSADPILDGMQGLGAYGLVGDRVGQSRDMYCSTVEVQELASNRHYCKK